MAEVPAVKPCSNPGCNQRGTKSCSACKTTVYCCVICQTADWNHHKEECDGHLRKVGMINLAKAVGFHREQNWVQALHYADLAATKLKQLKDRRLETVTRISQALTCKFDALKFMGRYREAHECIKECYTLWAMNHMRNPGSMKAALGLIQSCLHNKEFEDAEHYARHAYFMIAEMTDNFIPADQWPQFLADASYWLARAILKLAQKLAGGIPQEEKQKEGEEAIELAHKALEIHSQRHGTESAKVAADMVLLADILDHFNNAYDDETLRLREQSIVIFRRVEGSSSPNVAVGEEHFGCAYVIIAEQAKAANDVDRCIANYELALPHLHEAARIYSAINRVGDSTLKIVAGVEASLQRIRLAKAAADADAAAAAATTRG